MIELTPVSYDSPEYDMNGDSTYAELKINNMVIPLGEESLNELIKEVKEFKDTYTYCHECKYFVYNKYGYRGSCLRKAKEAGTELSPNDYGYVFDETGYSSCTKGEKKEDSTV